MNLIELCWALIFVIPLIGLWAMTYNKCLLYAAVSKKILENGGHIAHGVNIKSALIKDTLRALLLWRS